MSGAHLLAPFMAGDVFVDTAGLYALADRRYPYRPAVIRSVSELVKTKRRLVLTDYILDEAATLAKARSGGHAAVKLLEIAERSGGFEFVWIGAERFAAAKKFFCKHIDHGYSFTDCTSFLVMREMRLTEALSAARIGTLQLLRLAMSAPDVLARCAAHRPLQARIPPNASGYRPI